MTGPLILALLSAVRFLNPKYGFPKPNLVDDVEEGKGDDDGASSKEESVGQEDIADDLGPAPAQLVESDELAESGVAGEGAPDATIVERLMDELRDPATLLQRDEPQRALKELKVPYYFTLAFPRSLVTPRDVETSAPLTSASSREESRLSNTARFS